MIPNSASSNKLHEEPVVLTAVIDKLGEITRPDI